MKNDSKNYLFLLEVGIYVKWGSEFSYFFYVKKFYRGEE